MLTIMIHVRLQIPTTNMSSAEDTAKSIKVDPSASIAK